MKNVKTVSTQNKKQLTLVSLFLASAIITGVHTKNIQAQDDMLDQADEVLNGNALQMDDIDLEGKLSPSEKLRQRREKLEERNKIMVEKKIEDVRIKQEIALTNKLQDAFGKSLNNLNEEKVPAVVQPAPIAPQPVIVPAAVVETKIVEVKEVLPFVKEVKIKKSKIIPYIGATSLKGDRIDFESKMNLGVNVEMLVMPQVSVGMGVGFTSLDITDVAEMGTYNSGMMGTGYSNSFGSGRQMSSKKTTIEINSKFFFTEEFMLKPFIGAGISYNRSDLNYVDNGNGYNYNGINFGNEGYSSTSMGATIKLGTEVDFNETVGLNIDLSYSKTLSSGIANSATTSFENPDEVRLKNVTKLMEDADIMAVQVGVAIKF